MSGHTPWHQIRHKKPPWWNLNARVRRFFRMRRRRKALVALTRESENWPGGYR